MRDSLIRCAAKAPAKPDATDDALAFIRHITSPALWSAPVVLPVANSVEGAMRAALPATREAVAKARGGL